MFTPDKQRLVLNAEHGSWRVFRNTILLVIAMTFPTFGYYFAERFGEPYPWLIMPAFRGDHRDADGNFSTSRVNVAVRFADGGEETLSLMELFSPAPSATTSRIYSFIILPKPGNDRTREDILGTPETSRFYYVKRFIQPGFVPRKVNDRPAAPHPETIQWLSNRVAELYLGRKATELRFERIRMQFDTVGNPLGDGPTAPEVETIIKLNQP